jgi:hypothetical protein
MRDEPFHLVGLRLLFDPPGMPDRRTGAAVDEASGLHTGEPISCAACGHGITDAAARTTMNGSFDHSFRNPQGLSFHIGCFSRAPGCVTCGEPTLEYTWFAGYAWRVALCAGCRTHLGWRYDGAGGGFFGLILARLSTGRSGPVH